MANLSFNANVQGLNIGNPWCSNLIPFLTLHNFSSFNLPWFCLKYLIRFFLCLHCEAGQVMPVYTIAREEFKNRKQVLSFLLLK